MLRPKWRLIIRKVVVVLMAMMVIFISVSALMISIFRNDIIEMAWKQLKATITTPSNVEAIDLSFWSSFPMVSIELKNFSIEDAFAKDTLFKAERTYLSFDIWDAWRGKYEVNKLILSHGSLILNEHQRYGKNWMVMDTSANVQDSLPFSLKRLVLEEFSVRYQNDKGLRSVVFIEQGKLKGDFSVDQIDLEVDLNGSAKRLEIEQREWLNKRSIQLSGKVYFDKIQEKLTFEETDFHLSQSAFHLDGWVNFAKGELNCTLNSDEMQATDLMQSMPDFIAHWVTEYEPNGRLSFKSNAKGTFNNPEIVADIIWQEGKILEPKSQMALESLDLSMSYHLKDHADALEIHSLNAGLGGGQCVIKGSVKNLTDPEVNVHMEMEANIEDVKEYLKWDTLEVAKGRIQINADLAGRTSVLADSTIDWTKLNVGGVVIIQDGDFQFKKGSIRLSNVYSVMQLFEQSAQVQQFKANVGNSWFEIEGSIQNLIPYLTTKEQNLTANIEFHSGEFDLKDFVVDGSNHSVNIFLPRTYWNLKGIIDHFQFEEVRAENIQFNAKAEPRNLVISDFFMNFAQGRCSGNFELSQSKDDFWLTDAKVMLSGINMKEGLRQFNNLGQEVIRHEQLSGNLDANIELNFWMDQQWNLNRPSIQFVADVELSNGNIEHLQWLQEVSEYIKKNRWIAPVVDEDLLAQRLENVQFSKLKNIISLSNEVLDIPWMEINTSAFNMVMRATHHFNVDLNYLFGIQVSDLLLRDPSQKPKEDGKKMYILMKGPPGALAFSVEKEPEDFVFNANADEQKLKWKDRLRSKWVGRQNKRDVNPKQKEESRETHPQERSKRKKRSKRVNS